VHAGTLIDRAVTTLRASTSLDHSQRGRERNDAEELMMFALGVEEVPDQSDEILDGTRRAFEAMVERRVTGEPIAYITGVAEFRGLELIAEPGSVVPRHASDFLAEQAIRRLRRRKRPVHVDLATGVGTIALAVANEVPTATVYGADLSDAAVRLARRNAKRLGLSATFRAGDLFDGVPGRIAGTVDVITMHAPYIRRWELEYLADEVRRWEPEHTLTDGSDFGLELVVRVADEGERWLRPGGWLLIEVSPDRTQEVRRLMRAAGMREIASTKGGLLPMTRVVVGRRGTAP
jgi:release factor glutamine methyltransferase